MSIYDMADHMKDAAEKSGVKLAKAVNMLSGISGDDDRADILDVISDAIAIVEEVTGEIY